MTKKLIRKTREKKAVACPPREKGIKSIFLGPQSENAAWTERQILELFKHYVAWRKSRFPADGKAISAVDQKDSHFLHYRTKIETRLRQLMRRLEHETPKFTPRYIGHMVSETAIPAFLGQVLLLLHNPNNASPEVAKVSSQIEREAIGDLLKMIGMSPVVGRGHFTSGGTIANIEGLWRARYRSDHWFALGAWLRAHGGTKTSVFQASHMGWDTFRAAHKSHGLSDELLRSYSWVMNSPWQFVATLREKTGIDFKGPVVLVPGHKHYSWRKGISLLGLGEDAFWPIALDKNGKLSLASLRSLIERARQEDRPILCVVSVCGTTELGEIDPIGEVQDLLDHYRHQEGLHIWHHVDAAYGGFFACLAKRKDAGRVLHAASIAALNALGRVDSLTLDPHKLGYVPYSCGAILLPDADHDLVSVFHAPYLSESSKPDSGWANVLEGSRSGSGAAATWMCSRTLGFTAAGYGMLLKRGVEARQQFTQVLQRAIPECRVVPHLDTNILCFCLAPEFEPTSTTNARTLRIYDEISRGSQFGISKTTLGLNDYRLLCEAICAQWQGRMDADGLVLIRLTLMNPFLTSREMNCDFMAEFSQMLQRFYSLCR